MLSWESTEINNASFEINEFRKKMSKYLMTLEDSKRMNRQFKGMIDNFNQDLKHTFTKSRDTIREMRNDSVVGLNGIMTVLGFGLD